METENQQKSAENLPADPHEFTRRVEEAESKCIDPREIMKILEENKKGGSNG